MIKIGIVVGSTRPGRRGLAVAQWAQQVASRTPTVTAGEVAVALVDLADFDLPLLNEPVPALFGDYRHPHTARWASTIGGCDGFVFVTPEYNHSVPASLKNAIDYLFAEWNDKAAGFVSYGVDGGVRAVEHLRLALAEAKVASVRTQVSLSVFADFEPSDPTDPDAPRVLRPGERHEPTLVELLGEVVAWSGALKAMRESRAMLDAEAVPA